jgi:hypothetical protein
MNLPPRIILATQDPLRDEFAKAALTGMLACADLSAGKPAAATTAYQYADAMLAERNKTQPAPPPLSHLDPIAALSPQETPTFTQGQEQNSQQDPNYQPN